jgi:hypothetical protein
MNFISSARQEIKDGPKTMSSQDEKLCDLCRERPATCHIMYGNLDETKDLCEACHQESSSPEDQAARNQIRDAIRNGKCRFCGRPAAGGSGGFIPFLGEQLFLWCEECRKDLAEFSRMPENALSEDDYPFDDEAAQQRLEKESAERERRQEEFMKQKVLNRRSKEGAS